MAEYKAVTPLVIGKDESDRDVYIYQDGIVPENVTAESRKRLLAEGFIVDVEKEFKEAEKKAAAELEAAEKKAKADKAAADKVEAERVEAEKKAAAAASK